MCRDNLYSLPAQLNKANIMKLHTMGLILTKLYVTFLLLLLDDISCTGSLKRQLHHLRMSTVSMENLEHISGLIFLQ